MLQWRLHNVFFLLLFCSSNGQRPRFPFEKSFTPLNTFLEKHSNMKPEDMLGQQRRFVLLAPDLLRTDSQENIYLQAYDLTSPVTVSISILDYTKSTILLIDSAILNPDNKFQYLKTIQLSSDRLNRDEKKNTFVYLKVTFEGYYTEEKALMVSFHFGYIFIQTDKPIYNPGDTVKFRAFVSSPSFKAFDSSISIDIQNSDGVAVKQFLRTRATDGVFADTYTLSEMVNEGTWTVIAKFDQRQQNTFTSKFEVKKYVLPAFNVTLTPRKSFLSVDDSELLVEISANYLYGQPVQGTAYVVFGVLTNQEMRRLPSVKQLSDLDKGVVKLSMEEIKQVYPNIKSLVGSSVYVKASVLTNTGSDLVEATKTGITIVDSPYVLSFKNTLKYFKPGLPFDFTIQVSHHDGSPAQNIPVKINLMDTALIVSSGEAKGTINMQRVQLAQTIIAETTQTDLRPDQQARQQIIVHPYTAFNSDRQNYLYISTSANTVSVGDRLSLHFSIRAADQAHRDLIKHITYLVLNKGKIINAQRMDVADQQVTSIGLTVTSEMMPSFRVVAFFSIPWAGREEVVSDSVWIDVADSCIGGLEVGPVDNRHRDYAPGKILRFQIRGDPGAKVGLVAVDNAVYLLSKERLTQRKIWDTVEHGDIGCTRGGGRDATGVFADAGLLYMSSAGFQTQAREALQCPGSTRGRRSAELLNRKARLESHYKEKLQNRCCKDGLRDIPMPYSCMRRSLYITEGWDCMLAFRYCCATYRNQVFSTEIPTTPPPMTTAPPTTTHPTILTFPEFHIDYMLVTSYAKGMIGMYPTLSLSNFCFLYMCLFHMPLFVYDCIQIDEPTPGLRGLPGRGVFEIPKLSSHSTMAERAEMLPTEFVEEEEGEYQDETEIYLRVKFFESWLWMNIEMPGKVNSDGLASTTTDHPLPDSITEWGILAISASPQTGFCVAEPYNVKAVKDFFVDLKLPRSVARNEQVEIKAVIHNYASVDLHVKVVLMKTEGMCSIAFKDRHTQEMNLPAESSIAVPYTIVPFEVGKHPLEVMVAARDLMGADRVKKTLWVVLDGVQKTEVWNTVLNPSIHGGTQTVHVPKIKPTSVVPNSVPETFINVRGHLFADSIDNSITEDSLGSLIQMPGGCVEQNLASVTLPLIATLYLDRSSSWDSVGIDRRVEAVRYIKRGYENQLAFRRSDGSYPPYNRQGPSTWITAYVVKVFSMAYSIIGIDLHQVCDPLVYLVTNKLRARKGDYKEDNPVYTTAMTGGLRGDDPRITLTAFVHIALAEAKQAGIICDSSKVEVENANKLTTQYLKDVLTTPGRRPYTVAIATYALALLGEASDLHQTLLDAAAHDKSHWPDRENNLFTLEATGYALLALIKMGRMEEAKAPFQWLNSQRRRGGGFGSTQSTMVVLQALSEYMIKKPPPENLKLDVDIRMAGRKEIKYHFNPTNSYAARSSRLPTDVDLEVLAKGNGEGILEVVTYYNQLHEVDAKTSCKDFELSVDIQESRDKPPVDAEKTYQITIKVRALGPRDVRMAVLDITLPTGFTPDNSDLEKLSSSVDQYISNFQTVDNLSDRGSLIVHLFKVSHKEPEIILFRLQQNFKVGHLQPSSVTVYEYYNPEHRCSRTYTPKEDKEELSRICENNVCRCTQDDCCVSKTDSENFLSKERETYACKGLLHVFKVKVLSVTLGYYDKYEMEIIDAIKLGVEAGVTAGQRRFFMSQISCRDGLNLKQGSDYLIMGPKEDQWTTDSETKGFNYMLGRDTWVERWPSAEECSRNPNMQSKCNTLSDAKQDLNIHGCRM
ncbi:complement C3-like [Melanotaenia boesemani]|uniref:complement C3-like n=1 Tax=Melanotaenia boesemani TaxID=1250792 RepID=UPI001C05B6A8|nr:complement C3-like [Melanotaenia boesemani]